MASRLGAFILLTAATLILTGCATIEKVADDPEINAGDEAGFTITVENDTGAVTPSEVFVFVEDPLPPQVLWSEDPDSDDCQIDGAEGAQVLTCEAILAEPGDEGDSVSVHITGLTGPEDCGLISNTAFIFSIPDIGFPFQGAPADFEDMSLLEIVESARIQGPAPPSFTANATITVNCPDLDVSKSPDGQIIDAGEAAVFDIEVANEGEGTASGVTLVDQLPPGLAFTDDSPDCEITGDTLTCDFGDLGPGETASVQVTSPTDEEDCGVLFNEATAEAENSEDTDEGDANIYVLCPEVDEGEEPGFVPGGVDLPDVNVELPESAVPTPLGTTAGASQNPIVSTGDGSSNFGLPSGGWTLALIAGTTAAWVGLIGLAMRRR